MVTSETCQEPKITRKSVPRVREQRPSSGAHVPDHTRKSVPREVANEFSPPQPSRTPQVRFPGHLQLIDSRNNNKRSPREWNNNARLYLPTYLPTFKQTGTLTGIMSLALGICSCGTGSVCLCT